MSEKHEMTLNFTIGAKKKQFESLLIEQPHLHDYINIVTSDFDTRDHILPSTISVGYHLEVQ